MKIYYKLNLLIISLLVILTVLVAGSVNIMVGQALEEEMQDKELAIAEYMAFTLADPLLNRDVVRVRAIIDDLMMQNADVRYIYVVGFDGTVVAHTFEGGFPVAFVTANPIPDGENTALRSLSVDGGSVRDVGVRLIDGMAAKVYIGFGMTRLVENTERITHTIIGIAALILLFGVSLSFFLTRRMIKHIESLAAGTKRVGGGDLDFRIDVASRDELGMLTDSFNQMTVECKRAEEALRTSKEIQDAILSTTNVLLAYMDREFNFIAVNQAYADAGHMRREDFVGKNHFDLYPHAENEQIFRKAVETGVTQVFSAKPFEYPDQPERGPTWWDWSLIPLKDGSGSVQALVFSLLDVTKRVRAEEDLQESEQNFRDLVENLMDGVAIADENAYHIYVNPKFSEITGYSRDELLNMTGWDFTRSEDRAKLKQRMKDRMAGTPVRTHYERIIVRKDGTEVPVEMSTTVTIWRGKTRPMAIIHNITERKRAEEELQERMDELETVYRTTLGREERVIELKQEVNELLEQLGKNNRYNDYSR